MLEFIAGEDWTDPELVIVSAGYDALRVDPLAQVSLEPSDFREMTKLLLQRIGHGRVVFGLEGGYDLHGVRNNCGRVSSFPLLPLYTTHVSSTTSPN